MITVYIKRYALIFLSWILVAFGQPAWFGFLGPLAASIAFALFWKETASFESSKKRFIYGFFFFFFVQAVQFSWFLSHPYYYIYFVYLALLTLYGIQFGFLTLLVKKKWVENIGYVFFLSGLWVWMEWSRLFWLSGVSFNPVGLYLSENIFSLQTASLGGVYLLSFLVIFTNLLFLRSLDEAHKIRRLAGSFLFALIPYFFGFFQISEHLHKIEHEKEKKLNLLLVQTAFPIEETLSFSSKAQKVAYVMDEWKEIAALIAKNKEKPLDLIVLPEICVPFGVYSCLFPLTHVEKVVTDAFGKTAIASRPDLDEYVFKVENTSHGAYSFVNNLFWIKWLSRLTNASILMGIEDVEDRGTKREYFSSAILVSGNQSEIPRYDKRILVPMGEYIPGEFLKSIASWYGIQSSFTPGSAAKVFKAKDTSFGVAICYEETFGNLMLENKKEGAELLVNLTSDGWFPDSRLPKQHLDHSRIRTVEMGVALVRSCNTGVTAAFDSLGREIKQLGEDFIDLQNERGSLFVELPIYHYKTFYSQTGDAAILGFSFLSLLFINKGRRKLKL